MPLWECDRCLHANDDRRPTCRFCGRKRPAWVTEVMVHDDREVSLEQWVRIDRLESESELRPL